MGAEVRVEDLPTPTAVVCELARRLDTFSVVGDEPDYVFPLRHMQIRMEGEAR